MRVRPSFIYSLAIGVLNAGLLSPFHDPGSAIFYPLLGANYRKIVTVRTPLRLSGGFLFPANGAEHRHKRITSQYGERRWSAP
jgi:hypothetical protein